MKMSQPYVGAFSFLDRNPTAWIPWGENGRSHMPPTLPGGGMARPGPEPDEAEAEER
jgi:hypothetical protein